MQSIYLTQEHLFTSVTYPLCLPYLIAMYGGDWVSLNMPEIPVTEEDLACACKIWGHVNPETSREIAISEPF